MPGAPRSPQKSAIGNAAFSSRSEAPRRDVEGVRARVTLVSCDEQGRRDQRLETQCEWGQAHDGWGTNGKSDPVVVRDKYLAIWVRKQRRAALMVADQVRHTLLLQIALNAHFREMLEECFGLYREGQCGVCVAEASHGERRGEGESEGGAWVGRERLPVWERCPLPGGGAGLSTVDCLSQSPSKSPCCLHLPLPPPRPSWPTICIAALASEPAPWPLENGSPSATLPAQLPPPSSFPHNHPSSHPQTRSSLV